MDGLGGYCMGKTMEDGKLHKADRIIRCEDTFGDNFASLRGMCVNLLAGWAYPRSAPELFQGLDSLVSNSLFYYTPSNHQLTGCTYGLWLRRSAWTLYRLFIMITFYSHYSKASS